MILVLLLATSCESKDKDKVRRLAAEVIELRKELQNTKSERDNIVVEFDTYRENYRQSQLSQEELIDEMVSTNMSIINLEGSLSHIFKMAFPIHNEEFCKYYGEILSGRLEEVGIDEFIGELIKHEYHTIDRVINYLVWESQEKEQLETLQHRLEEYEDNLTDNSDNKNKYVLYRAYLVIEEESQK